MTESTNSLQKLFQAGLTREQFIDRYTQLQQKGAKDSSIFNEEMATSIGNIFDALDTNKDNKLDENELKSLSSKNISDGKNVLSEDDLTVVYSEMAEKLTEEYKTTDPKEMYETAIKNGTTPEVYLSTISNQINLLNELISLRKSESETKLTNYQKQIDNLIMRNTELTNKFKRQYKDATDKLDKLNKQSEKYNTQLKNKNEKISDSQDRINSLENELNSTDANDTKTKESKQNELNKLRQGYSGISDEYKDLAAKRGAVSAQISQITDKISTMRTDATSKESNLKERISIINDKIKTEQKSAKEDIKKYESKLSVLNKAQDYALQTMAADYSAEGGVADDYYDEDTSNYSYDSGQLKAKWSKKAPHLTDGFYNKATAVAKRIGCDPNALMAVMSSESNLKANIANSRSGATGLIQFMPKTARNLGTSTQALRNMSAEQQLTYVEKYLQANKKMAGFKQGDKLDSGTLYALVFLPGFAKKNVLTTRGSKYYNANTGLDVNHDGQITKADLAKRLHKFMP